MVYSRIGGNYQLLTDNFDHLKSILELDEAFWALNCIDINSLRMDRRFLSFMDANNDGKIRTDEIREAVTFLLTHLKDGSGFENASDVLDLNHIAPEAGAPMLESGNQLWNRLLIPIRNLLCNQLLIPLKNQLWNRLWTPLRILLSIR